MGKQKPKRKLTAAEKAEKKRRRREYKTIFINGKQKRVKREPTIEGLPVDEFIRRNADPIWLLQNGVYEELHQWEMEQMGQQEEQEDPRPDPLGGPDKVSRVDDDLPF
jgi:16S rRNA U516 pseudouridylate synthase RsuA-like enzyme